MGAPDPKLFQRAMADFNARSVSALGKIAPFVLTLLLLGTAIFVGRVLGLFWLSFLIFLTFPLPQLLHPQAYVRAVARKMAAASFFRGAHEAVLTGRGFSVETPDVLRRGPWSAVRAVHLAGDLAVLDHGRTEFTVLPNGRERFAEIQALWRGTGEAETTVRLAGTVSGKDLGLALGALSKRKWWGRAIVAYCTLGSILLVILGLNHFGLGNGAELLVLALVLVGSFAAFRRFGTWSAAELKVTDQTARLEAQGYEIKKDGVIMKGHWTGEEGARRVQDALELQIGPGWLELIPMEPARLEAAVADVTGWIVAAKG